ncbi:MAG: hypothetical protein V2I33_25580, partial [Kangiellaceae bacterium]|nr:hypothetical protein [Kangiellaceae bacterium]
EADTGDPTEKLKARLELLSQMLSKATEIAAEATKDADKAHEELNRVLSRAEATAMNTAKSLTPEVVETTEKMVEKAKAARETPFGRGTDRTSQEALTQKAEAVRELNNFSYSALAAVYEQALDALEELADKLQARADKETADQIEDLKTAAMTAKAI